MGVHVEDVAGHILVATGFFFFFVSWFSYVLLRGGCSLVRRSALENAGGLEAIRHAIIDDVALATAIKSSGSTTFLGLADDVESVRPYPDLGMLWRMVSRSAYAQLDHSLWLLIGSVLGLGLIFWVPPLAVVSGDAWTAALGSAGWLLMAALYVPMLRYYRLTPLLALALPLTTTLYLGMTVDSAIRHYRGAGGAWKGRTYA